MANYGAKVSRIGYPVESASDKQLAFSSDWPLLPIEAEGDVTINGTGEVLQDIYVHNLGYEPVFYVCRTSGDFFWPGWLWCNSEKIWFDGYTNSNIELKWKVFRRPLKTNYISENINVTDATKKIDDDYGVLISLPGKSIISTDKRDFSIRSDVRQLMVSQSGYTTEPISEATITHNLGYRPSYLVYMESDSVPGNYRFATAAADYRSNATTTQLNWILYTPPGLNWAYIIFKDTLTTNG